MADLDQTHQSSPRPAAKVYGPMSITCKTRCRPDNLEGMTPAEIEKFAFFVGYLERIGPEGHKQLESLDPTTEGTVAGTRVRNGIARNHGQIRLLNTPDADLA